MKVFEIEGYFTDDKSEFGGYLVAELDTTPKGYSDEDIFFYGLSEENIRDAIATGEPIDDFVIQDYTEA